MKFTVKAPLQVGTPSAISCGASDPELDAIELKFEGRGLTMSKYKGHEYIDYQLGSTSWIRVEAPSSRNVSGVRIETPNAEGRIAVTLWPRPKDNGTDAICSAKSVSRQQFPEVPQGLLSNSGRSWWF